MQSAYNLISAMRSNSGKLAKLALLEAEQGNNDLKEYLRAAYEPKINFYTSVKSTFKAGLAQTPTETIVFTRELFDEIITKLTHRQIKGKAAKIWLATLHASFANDWERELLELLIGRDMKSGFNVSTVNKVWPNLITDLPYMRCCLPKHTKLKNFPWAEGVFSQIKADGMFANVSHLDDGTVTITSRAGSEFPLEYFSDLVASVKANIPRGMQIHGEMLMIQHGKVLPRQVGNGMFNKILNEGEPEEDGLVAVYDAWDMIPLSEVKVKNKYKVKYSIRFQKLIDAVKSNAQTTIRIIDYKMVYSIKEAYEHYKECLEAGLEGTVVKNPYAIWEDGTSGDQVKLKLEAPCELEIVSFNPGNGKNAKTFGSINCKSSDGKVVVRVPGTSDEMRDYFHANRDSMPGKIITVKSNFLTPPSGNKLTYSLFLPVFLEERKDKHEADSLERIIEQFEAAIRDVTDME